MSSESPKIDYTILGDGYVMVYSKEKNKFIFVDPDEVLKQSAIDDNIPKDFIDKLQQDLDDKIDVDSGGF